MQSLHVVMVCFPALIKSAFFVASKGRSMPTDHSHFVILLYSCGYSQQEWVCHAELHNSRPLVPLYALRYCSLDMQIKVLSLESLEGLG